MPMTLMAEKLSDQMLLIRDVSHDQLIHLISIAYHPIRHNMAAVNYASFSVECRDSTRLVVFLAGRFGSGELASYIEKTENNAVRQIDATVVMTRIHPSDPHVMALAEHMPKGMISEADYNFLVDTFSMWASILRDHEDELNVVVDMQTMD
jgi:hypothetical protein